MTTPIFYVGSALSLDALFTNEAGDPTDPTDITVEIRLPDQTVVDLTADVVKNTVGSYSVQFTPEQNGLHVYRFDGDGALIVAGEKSFLAQTQFPPES